MYKVFDPVSKTIGFMNMDKGKIEACLVPFMKDVTYLTRGKKYATVEVRFSMAARAMEAATKSLTTKEVVLLPSYMGKNFPCAGGGRSAGNGCQLGSGGTTKRTGRSGPGHQGGMPPGTVVDRSNGRCDRTGHARGLGSFSRPSGVR